MKENPMDPKYGWRRMIHKPSLYPGYNFTYYQRATEDKGMAESAMYMSTFTNCPNP